MIIRLTACVGVFSAQIECESTAEADHFVKWVYALEGKEERQAIVTESETPAEPKPQATEAELPPATVEEAVAEVKKYAAKHTLEKARELMQEFGVGRTSEITPEIAPKIVAKIKAGA